MPYIPAGFAIIIKMSSAISNKFAKCDDVIVNFVSRCQTIVKFKEFKEHVEEWESVVLTDEQAKEIFHKWLKSVHGQVDGQQAIVDVELDTDNDMDYLMDHLWDDVINDNIDIPDDWQVAKCQAIAGCSEISVGNYGKDNTPLCEDHKMDGGYCSCGAKEDDCEVCKPVGCEHPSPEVKEVVTLEATPVKQTSLADLLSDDRDTEIEALKDRVMRLEMAMIRINSKVVFEIAKTTETLLNSGPAFPVTMVSKKDILLAFEKLQSTLSSVLVNPI